MTAISALSISNNPLASALVVGGDSTIGGALAIELAAQGTRVTATSRRAAIAHLPLNLAAKPDTWPELPAAEVAFFCAAITKLDMCENHPDTTRIINVTHIQSLAEMLQAQGTFVIFLSSNQVFDGTAPYRKITDPVNPVSEYGRQKAEFEAWLLARPVPASIMRLSKVVSGPLPMLDKWREALAKGEAVEAFTDLAFAPLPLQCVLQGMQEIAVKKLAGITHLSGLRELSYYDIACELAKRMGADTALVKPTKGKDSGIPEAFLPRHATLESSAFKTVTVPDPLEVLFPI